MLTEHTLRHLRAKFWCDTVLQLMQENPHIEIKHLAQQADQMLEEFNDRFTEHLSFKNVRGSINLDEIEQHAKSADAPEFPLDDSAKWTETQETGPGMYVVFMDWNGYTITIDNDVHTLTKGGVTLRVLKRAAGELSTELVHNLKAVAQFHADEQKRKYVEGKYEPELKPEPDTKPTPLAWTQLGELLESGRYTIEPVKEQGVLLSAVVMLDRKKILHEVERDADQSVIEVLAIAKNFANDHAMTEDMPS